MLGYGDLLTNSTDASLKMCAGEFGPKIKKLARLIHNINSRVNYKQAQVSKGPLANLTWEGNTAHEHKHLINPRRNLLDQSDASTRIHGPTRAASQHLDQIMVETNHAASFQPWFDRGERLENRELDGVKTSWIQSGNKRERIWIAQNIFLGLK